MECEKWNEPNTQKTIKYHQVNKLTDLYVNVPFSLGYKLNCIATLSTNVLALCIF